MNCTNYNQKVIIINDLKNSIIQTVTSELFKVKKNVIVSPDADGLLSYILFKEFINKNLNIVGSYDCKTLSLNKSLDPIKNETFGLDLYIKFVDTLDHHLLNVKTVKATDQTFIINLNYKEHNKRTCIKCPYNTTITMCIFYDNLKKELYKRIDDRDFKFVASILYGDNWLNHIFKKYRSNASSWLLKNDLEYLLDFIEEFQVELTSELYKLNNFFKQHGFTKNKPGLTIQSKKTLNCDAADMQKTINDLAIYLGYRQENEEFTKIDDFTIINNYYDVEMSLDNLQKVLNEEPSIIVSHAQTSNGIVKVTLYKDPQNLLC